MYQYVSANPKDDANFYCCKNCLRHFIMEDEKDRHELECARREIQNKINEQVWMITS